MQKAHKFFWFIFFQYTSLGYWVFYGALAVAGNPSLALPCACAMGQLCTSHAPRSEWPLLDKASAPMHQLACQ